MSGPELKSGEYLFPKRASVRDVVETMVEGKVVQHLVTIPEGLTSEQIAARLGFTPAEITRLRHMALLHDIGKLAVPNRILDKRGPLTPDEIFIVREHPRHTFEILRRVPIFDELALDAGAHHERLDGRGYYLGLDRTKLSKSARVLAVADVTDALRADRPYRKGMPADAIARVLSNDRDTALCPDAVDAAIDVLGADTPAPARPALLS